MLKSKDMLIVADRDMDVCAVLEKEFPERYALANAGFHLQQAAEKLIKGLMLISGYQPQNTNNISDLATQCRQYGITLPERLNSISETLALWESATHSDPTVIPSTEEYQKAKYVCSELRERLVKELKFGAEQTNCDLADMKIK